MSATLTGLRVKVILLIFLLLPVLLLAQQLDVPELGNKLLQNGKTDTASIVNLMAVGQAFIDRPDAKREDMDMATRMADEMDARSRKANFPRGIGLANLLRAEVFRESGHAADGRSSATAAVKLLSSYGTISEKAQALIELGGTFSSPLREQIPQKIAYYEAGIAAYQQTTDTLKVAQLKEYLSDLYQVNQEYSRSLKLLQEALLLYQKVGYKRLHGLYCIMSQDYHGLNNFVESLRYNLKAGEIGEDLGDHSPQMSTIYNRIGLNYYTVLQYDQAIEYFHKALVIAKNNKDSTSMKSLLFNLADSYRIKNQFKHSLDLLSESLKLGVEPGFDQVQMDVIYLRNYISLKAQDKAAPHFQRLLGYMADPAGDKFVKEVIRVPIISYLQFTGRFKESEKYIRDFQQNLGALPVTLAKQTEAEYYFFRTDSAMGRLPAAIMHLQKYKSLSDSITSTAQARQLDILHLQFQTERKDQNIQLLTQKSKLQEVSLQRGRVFRNVIVGGICMLLLILALLYNSYRLKKRTAFSLQQHQEEINRQNELLKKLLDEKEWLLKEIHHRVKNNLQIIISLLNTQSQYLDNRDAIAAIKTSQHRMYVMSLIHQRLYHTDNLGAIDMNWYICELMGFMKESFDTGSKIRFDIANESIMLDVVQAIPVGLILNEAVSNALKYAFPDGRKGTIQVSFRKEEQYCLLSIADDGVGFRENYFAETSASLGMSLMRGLTDQLEGNFDLQSGTGGVAIKIRFLIRILDNKN